ncbi:mediator of RNA polymerase II transcription subunit 15a [Ziziphus jujuba]|uniref:Mediator of RNA polymerase II transcription subunit 15a n=1 Tax=Ziziphus jujuba TaxID=326968 RepID=A0ABM4A892_ZIZJJ|nr:mediator of RNA polymerase II transcription subunit 15a [Ziziphus jujuba]
MAQQSNLSNMHQQQLGPQSSVTGLQQQQQLLGSQTGNSSMQTNQHSMHMLQQSKAPGQQQPQQSASTLLPTQGQQSQPQQSQQQLLSQIQSQAPQMQQQLGLQQQPNPLQRDMPQRLQPSGQGPGSLLQQQNVIDQQKQLYQSQRALPEMSSTSLDSTAQTGHASGGDWKEEVYQKIKSLKDLYFADMNEMSQKIALKLQQHDSLQQPKTEQGHKDKLPLYEKQIVSFVASNRPRRPASSLQQGQLDNNNWRPIQSGEPTMDTSDWRSQLQPDSRQKIINKMYVRFEKI